MGVREDRDRSAMVLEVWASKVEGTVRLLLWYECGWLRLNYIIDGVDCTVLVAMYLQIRPHR